MNWLLVIVGLLVTIFSAAVMADGLRLSERRSLTEREYSETLAMAFPVALGLAVTAVGVAGMAG